MSFLQRCQPRHRVELDWKQLTVNLPNTGCRYFPPLGFFFQWPLPDNAPNLQLRRNRWCAQTCYSFPSLELRLLQERKQGVPVNTMQSTFNSMSTSCSVMHNPVVVEAPIGRGADEKDPVMGASGLPWVPLGEGCFKMQSCSQHRKLWEDSRPGTVSDRRGPMFGL